MNMKRASIFAGVVGGLAIAGAASGQSMTGMSYDVVGEDLVAGTYTVRVYAEMEADSRIDAVFGNAETSIELMGMNGASFYQNSLGGPTSTSINSAFFALAPSLEHDSYVTIGALHLDGTPFGENGLLDIGIDWAPWEAGGDLSANDGTWFVTPDKEQGAEVGGRVLLAQLTIYGTHGDGVVDAMFKAGFQGKDTPDETGDTWQLTDANANGANMIYIDAIPAPGAIALLGLAGLAGRRRRRG